MRKKSQLPGHKITDDAHQIVRMSRRQYRPFLTRLGSFDPVPLRKGVDTFGEHRSNRSFGFRARGGETHGRGRGDGAKQQRTLDFFVHTKFVGLQKGVVEDGLEGVMS